VACLYPTGGHARPCPTPDRAAITRGWRPRTPPWQRNPGRADHNVVLSDRLLGDIS